MEKQKTKKISVLVACLVVLAVALLVPMEIGLLSHSAVHATGEATLDIDMWWDFIIDGDFDDPESIITARDVDDTTDATLVGTNVYAKYDSTKKQVVLFSNIDSPIYLPEVSDGLFGLMISIEEIDLEYVNTSLVTSMAELFYGCESLTSLNLSSFDTSNVTNMNSMFNTCSSLTSLDLRGFDTSSVETMLDMFFGCSSLTSLDLSSFDLSNVTDMTGMFAYCGSLTSLDLSSFDLSNIGQYGTDDMFRSCSALAEIYLPNNYGETAILFDADFVGISASNGTTVVKANALENFEPSDNNVKRKIVRATAQNEAELLAQDPSYFESSYPVEDLPGTGVVVDIMAFACLTLIAPVTLLFVTKRKKEQF